MRNWAVLGVGFFFLVALTACQGLSGTKLLEAEATVNEMLADGVITPEQAEALIAALRGSMSEFWDVALQIGGYALTALLTYFGINLKRGPITARKGTIAASQVKP